MLRSALFTLLSIFIFAGCNSNNSSEATNAPASVPEFTFLNMADNTPVTRTSLAIQGNIVFVFFDTGCIHCRNEITAMGENFSQFKDATFYMVSQQDKAIITDFMNTYGSKMRDQPNVHVLLDSRYEFLAKFKPMQYPALYVYGPDRKLKAFMEGENGIDQVIAAVNK
ncbi:TlpA family protein disulfide reductase [Albibacterium bauzanense]|uniref:AhpC/TSA family protein n=1 Tax=Albibacterium bauzanense TaxID=653929 RepID=A0A4V2PYC3_9SPHI|nr:redoxin domain-containing protein [Albibacterium bauzanense]TCK85471.1 AhpC/TSA family protein [Albibacterium bauzanense]